MGEARRRKLAAQAGHPWPTNVPKVVSPVVLSASPDHDLLGTLSKDRDVAMKRMVGTQRMVNTHQLLAIIAMLHR